MKGEVKREREVLSKKSIIAKNYHKMVKVYTFYWEKYTGLSLN